MTSSSKYAYLFLFIAFVFTCMIKKSSDESPFWTPIFGKWNHSFGFLSWLVTQLKKKKKNHRTFHEIEVLHADCFETEKALNHAKVFK